MKQALESVPEDARRLMAWKLKTLANVVNNWSMNTNTMGVYGDYYLKRAIVTQLGLGANMPEDAIYPIDLGDEASRPLDGANKYVLHFDKGATPPASAFWSVTLYDQDGYQVANPLDRFALRKLVGTDAIGSAGQGHSVALSADGNTAIVGGLADNRIRGAAWV